MKYFSKTTNGFYDPEINGENMPDDVVEVPDNEYEQLIAGQSSGQKIVGNDNGYPILVDVVLTQDELIDQCARTAKAKLVATDWSQYSDVAETLLNKAEFDAYRSTVRGLLLRPVPNPTWPTEPTAVWKE